MSIRKELAQKVIAIVIIIIMTLADFAIVGINAISYAIDIKITNSDNVEFCAYFVDDSEQQLTNIDSNINSSDLKVYIEISVKNEGYFNGQISLENTSFKFKKDTTNEFVKQIDDNTIILNQINAGITGRIEVGIEFANEECIELQYLNKENQINLIGIYKNSKKDIEIQGNTTLRINWKSQEELNAKIDAKILTNKIYEIEEKNKKIVQILVDSKLENDLYPIKNTNLKLNVPEGVEEVKVHARSTDATNGNYEFNVDNFQYNSETGILDINIQNEEKEGKISWLKNKKDSLVITYIYPEEISLEEQEINVQNIITTYDEKQIKANCKIIVQKEIDGILTFDINLDEDKIYKGKLYTNEERFYTTATVINVNKVLMDKIQIKEKEAVYCIENDIKQANIQYVQSKISKAEFYKIFGQEGYITILDQDGNTIANLNKDSEVDENGYFNINYNLGIKSIMISTSKPLIEQTIKIHHKKVILDNKYSREQIKTIIGIQEEIINSNGLINVKKIKLEETESKASIKVSTDTLLTLKDNKNVEIIATLETNDESKELYKNPSVDVIFPKEIKKAKILSAKALYRNGLKVANCEKIINEDGNIVLHIDFEGEQKKYNSEILNGLEIHIYADIVLDKTIPNKTTEFIMNYTNYNGNKELYSVSEKVNIESQDGLFLYNSLSNYNKQNEIIEVINEEQVTAKLDTNSKVRIAKVETAIINNYDKNITDDIVIIGKIPVKNGQNTFNTKISNLNISAPNAKVFYSTDINVKANDKSWTDENTNAKSYKVILNGIKSSEVVKISYDLSIPAKLAYNEKGILTTNIKYNYEQKEISNVSKILLETETAILKTESIGNTINTDTGLEVSIVASSGNRELKEGDSIFDGETIRYTVSIKNNTGSDLKGLNIKATQINGKIFDLVEKEVYNRVIYDGDGKGIEHYWEVTEFNNKEFNGVDINNGDTKTIEYQIVVEKGDEKETSGNIVITSSDKSIQEDIATGKYIIKDAELKMTFVPGVSEECTWLTETVQQSNLEITNLTDKDLENVEVRIILMKGLSIDQTDNYINCNSDIKVEIKNKTVNNLNQTIITLQIDKIKANATGEIYFKHYILECNDKKGQVELCAESTVSNNIYTSNNIIREVVKIKKQIINTQVAKINDIVVSKDSIANDGDRIDFYINVKNLDKEDADLNIYNYIQRGLKIKNVTLEKNDKTKIDITDKYNTKSFTYDVHVLAGEEIDIIISASVDIQNMNEEKSINNNVRATDNDTGEKYNSSVEINVNIPEKDDGYFNITVEQSSSPNDKAKIKDGQEIQYNVKIKNTCNFDRVISILDYFNIALKDIRIIVNGNDVTSKYLIKNNLQINDYKIKGNEEINIIIKAIVDLNNYQGSTISNSVVLKSIYPDCYSNTITYYTSNEIIEDDEIDDEEDDYKEEQVRNYNINGCAWIDTNKNGKREQDERMMNNMEIRAIDTKTQQLLDVKSITNDNGTYQLILPEGKYIIVFIYNNEEYYITTYHADNVDNKTNSDATSKNFTLNNLTGTYGATDVINLTSNKDNLDIGLVKRSKLDFELEKYVSKVVVTNKGGTKTYNFDKASLGKVEIHSKYLSNSTVLVEYTIKVKNVGDIAGRVENIVDNMPSDMTFSSSLNAEWYKSGKKLYTESLTNKELDKGETAEIKLILTKKMTDSNTGLINNTALIQSIKNLEGLEDINSNNDKGSADLIISIKTGDVPRLILLVLSFIICIVLSGFLVIRRNCYYKI